MPVDLLTTSVCVYAMEAGGWEARWVAELGGLYSYCNLSVGHLTPLLFISVSWVGYWKIYCDGGVKWEAGRPLLDSEPSGWLHAFTFPEHALFPWPYYSTW